MIHHLAVRNAPFTRRGKIGSRAEKRLAADCSSAASGLVSWLDTSINSDGLRSDERELAGLAIGLLCHERGALTLTCINSYLLGRKLQPAKGRRTFCRRINLCKNSLAGRPAPNAKGPRRALLNSMAFGLIRRRPDRGHNRPRRGCRPRRGAATSSASRRSGHW